MQRKSVIALDCDDVLYDCMGYAIEITNAKYHLDPPLTISDYVGWGRTGDSRLDLVFELFTDREFYETQPLLPGAREFVDGLLRSGYDVVIPTAVDPRVMDVRINRLVSDFAPLPRENVLPVSRKELINSDLTLDDNAENILRSRAGHKVLYRRPWSKHLTGLLAVNNLTEADALIRKLLPPVKFVQPTLKPLICLVGPSGSGKTAIANELVKTGSFAIAKSYTTRERRDAESDEAYHFISKEQFNKMLAEDAFFEFSVYAGHDYGSANSEVKRIWDDGLIPIKPIDIAGANSMVAAFGERVITVFIKRSKSDILDVILGRNVPDADKRNRILSLDTELRNEELCDFVINNNRSLSDAVNQIKRIVGPTIE